MVGPTCCVNRGGEVMAGAPKPVRVEAGSEVARLLDAATEADVLLEKEGIRFRINRVDPAYPTPDTRRRRLRPERVLNIIGLGAAADQSDVARLKDRYVADAADRRA